VTAIQTPSSFDLVRALQDSRQGSLNLKVSGVEIPSTTATSKPTAPIIPPTAAKEQTVLSSEAGHSQLRALINSKRRRRLTVKDILPRSKPAKHAKGLNNLGNTCFMNSALQCLFSSDLLVSFFLYNQYEGDIHPSSPMRGHLASAFAEVVQDIWSSGSSSVTPHKLKRQFERFAPEHFIGNRFVFI
jgi:ubiquitin C-terminal hydrolase